MQIASTNKQKYKFNSNIYFFFSILYYKNRIFGLCTCCIFISAEQLKERRKSSTLIKDKEKKEEKEEKEILVIQEEKSKVNRKEAYDISSNVRKIPETKLEDTKGKKYKLKKTLENGRLAVFCFAF